MGRKARKKKERVQLGPAHDMEDKKIKVSLCSGGRVWLVAILVAMLTLFIYVPALQNDFVNWDDDKSVYENKHIMSVDFEFLKWSFTAFYKSNWHPLTWLSHAIDYAIWGLNPMGHHLSSIMLHGMNTFLLCILIFYLLNNKVGARNDKELIPPNPPLVKGGVRGDFHFRGAVIAGGITALLFGIHPVHVESVAWVAERKDVLSAFFVLLSLIFYVKYVVRQELIRQSFYYISSLIFFVLALMSKPMAVTLPVMLVILDIYPFQRFSFRGGVKAQKKVVIEKVPFLFFSLVSSILTIMAQHTGGAIKSLEMYPLSVRIGVAIKGVCFYLAKMVYPIGLSPFYPHPKSISFLSFEYLFSIILVVAISVFCIWTWKRGWKVFLTIWVFYVVTLLPVLGIVQVGAQAAADRYAYIPSIGPFLLIGLGVSLIWEKTYFKDRVFFLNKKLIILILIFILSLLGIQTLKQIKIWSDSITLWSYELERYPDNKTAYISRANAYAISGNYIEALKDLDRAIKLDPDSTKAYNNRGLIYKRIGDFQSAVKDFTKAIELYPEYAEAYNNRATAYITLGDYQKVLEDLNKAIELQPELEGPYINRCEMYNILANYQQAIKDCSRAIEIDPENAMAYNDRGLSYKALGRYQKAVIDYNKAISLAPEDYKAYYNRGNAYRRMGKNQKAVKDLSKVIELSPEYLNAYISRGVGYGELGKFENSIKDFSKAIELNPNVASAYYNRGAAYYRLGKEKEAIRDFQKAARLGDKKIQELLKKRGIEW